MAMVTGGRLAAEALIERNVKYIFTLSGGHITPIYQHLEGSSVTLFDTRHEQAAAFMAEAWGKLTRLPGVCMVTAGPGFTNALTGIASAHFSNTPLVFIAGCVGMDHKEKLDLQDMDQEPVIRPMVKKTFVCQKPERVPEFIDMAFRTATTGRPGPVYLELPVDVLNATVEADTVRRPRTEPAGGGIDLAQTGAALALLAAAERPVIIAGSGLWNAGAGAELTAFVEAAGIPVFTSLAGRGVISDTHPLCFEGALAIRPGGAFAAYIETDLVLVLGTRIGLYYMFGDVINPAAKMIQVDVVPEEIGRNRAVDVPVVGDVRAFLTEANRRLADGDGGAAMKTRFQPWIDKLNQAHADGKSPAMADWQKSEKPVHPMRLAREIDDFMNREDDIVVADGGDTTTWMGMTRTLKTGGHYLDYGVYGSLGVGIPYANAAKLCYPEKRVLLITGDGSFGFNFMEMENAVRKGLPIVVVICNDQGWGMIRHSQEIRIGHAIKAGTWIGPINYHLLVAALGGYGALVADPADIRPALEAAFASGKTACINVMTDTTTVSPGSMALANVGAYKA